MAIVPQHTLVRILVTDEQGAREEWVHLTELIAVIESQVNQGLVDAVLRAQLAAAPPPTETLSD